MLIGKKIKLALVLGLVTILAGGSWYIYSQGQKIGELQGAADELQRRNEQDARKATQLTTQAELLEAVRRQGAATERRLLAALEGATEEFRRCFDMPVPDSMRIPQRLDDPGQLVDDPGAGTSPEG